MKKLVVVLLLFLPGASNAIDDLGMACDEIKRLRTWASGSDYYGIWVEFETNPQNCEGGFYVPHNSDNKQYVYSMLLAAKASNERMCIQIGNLNQSIQNRCIVNYVMHE